MSEPYPPFPELKYFGSEKQGKVEGHRDYLMDHSFAPPGSGWWILGDEKADVWERKHYEPGWKAHISLRDPKAMDALVELAIQYHIRECKFVDAENFRDFQNPDTVQSGTHAVFFYHEKDRRGNPIDWQGFFNEAEQAVLLNGGPGPALHIDRPMPGSRGILFYRHDGNEYGSYMPKECLRKFGMCERIPEEQLFNLSGKPDPFERVNIALSSGFVMPDLPPVSVCQPLPPYVMEPLPPPSSPPPVTVREVKRILTGILSYLNINNVSVSFAEGAFTVNFFPGVVRGHQGAEQRVREFFAPEQLTKNLGQEAVHALGLGDGRPVEIQAERNGGSMEMRISFPVKTLEGMHHGLASLLRHVGNAIPLAETLPDFG